MKDSYGENGKQSLFPLHREECKRKPAYMAADLRGN